MQLLQGNQHHIGGASDKPASQPIITTAFQVGNDSITRASTTAFISLPAAIMSSQAAKAASNVVSIAKKQTLQSTGIWEAFRRFLAIDPERSNGVPLNPHFRNPPPGANDPLQYDDPVTLPAGDIADNPYWKRDNRRGYPQLSVVDQSQFAQLLTVGSAEAPKVDLIGEAGEKQLVAVKQESETGLAKALDKAGNATKDVFVNGMPPLPSGQTLNTGKWDVHKYELEESSYGEGYPCRSFK